MGYIHEGPSSWRVAFCGKNGFNKSFLYAAWGGKDAARVAAEVYRQETSDANGWTKNRIKIDGDVLHVALPGGLVMKTDVEALSLVEAHKWCRSEKPHCTYAYRGTNDEAKATEYFHNRYTGFDMVDHINHDGLDNRKINLRTVTPRMNMHNIRKRKDNTSGHTGVMKIRGVSWTAFWYDRTRHMVQRSFSVNRHGEEEAKRLAIEARAEACRIYGILSE